MQAKIASQQNGWLFFYGGNVTAPTFVSGHTTQSDSSSLTTRTINTPTHAALDIIVIGWTHDVSPASLAISGTWNTLYNNVDIPSGSACFSIWWRQAAETSPGSGVSAEPSTYTITSASERGVGIAFAIRGADPTAIDASVSATTGNSATATLPAITSVATDCIRISMVATDGVSTPHGTAATLTKIGEISFSSAGSMSAYYKALGAPGSSGSETVSITKKQWAGVSFTFAPSTGGAVTVTPAAAQAPGAAAGPTVVLGSITTVPAQAVAIAAATGPTVRLGSITITPAAAQAISAAVGPTVILGSITITPGAAQATSTATGPLMGTVTPAAAQAISVATGPTVRLGSISFKPAAAVAISAAAGPTVNIISIAILLHLPDRSTTITLQTRALTVTLPARSLILTLQRRSQDG